MFRLRTCLASVFLCAFALPAKAQTSTIDKLCNKLSYKEQVKNSADYIPGVDVRGKPIASADLDSEQAQTINNPVVIPIEIDLAERYGLSLPTGIELKPKIAEIVIYDNGLILYQGKKISGDVQNLCKNYREQHKKNQSNQTEQHGHESPDPVLSSDKIEGQYPDDDEQSPQYND